MREELPKVPSQLPTSRSWAQRSVYAGAMRVRIRIGPLFLGRDAVYPTENQVQIQTSGSDCLYVNAHTNPPNSVVDEVLLLPCYRAG